MPPLRHIAVYVEEPSAGEFRWVLIERAGKYWGVIDKSDSAAETYQKAMAEGLIALQRMVEDLEVGPRAGEDHEPPAKEQHPRRQEDGDAPKPGKAFFGFGPAR